MKLYSTCYFGNVHTERDPEDAPVYTYVDQLIEDTGLDKQQNLKDAMDDRAIWRRIIKDVRVRSHHN